MKFSDIRVNSNLTQEPKRGIKLRRLTLVKVYLRAFLVGASYAMISLWHTEWRWRFPCIGNANRMSFHNAYIG
jgi:hypothetical protein